MLLYITSGMTSNWRLYHIWVQVAIEYRTPSIASTDHTVTIGMARLRYKASYVYLRDQIVYNLIHMAKYENFEHISR